MAKSTPSAADLPDGTVVIDDSRSVAYIRNHPTAHSPWRGTDGSYSADRYVDLALSVGAHVIPPVDPVVDLRREFAELDASGASSNDIVQMLDGWLVDRGYPSVLYGQG